MANASFISAAGVGTTTYVSSANPLPVTATGGTGTSANQIQGTAAANAAVAGNPVLNGASDGTNAQNLVTINGALAQGTAGTGTLAVESPGNSWVEITTATTTVVKGTPGILHKVVVNTPTSTAIIKIYNAATATGTPITITCSATVTTPFELIYDAYFGTAITVVTTGAAAADVTVLYR